MQQRKPTIRRNITREERRHRAQQRKLRRNIFIGVGVSAVAAFLITALLLPSLPGSGPRGTPSEARVGDFQASIGDQHVNVGIVPEYSTTPPTSGPHYDETASWGVYEREVLDQQVVHNLEHGGVVISHNLTDADQVAALRSFAEAQPGFPGCLIMRPYPDIAEGMVVLTAWEWLQEFPGVDTEGMQPFIDAHTNRGPENVGIGCGG